MAQQLLCDRATERCPQFEKGDQVWLNSQHLHFLTSQKLTQQHHGPFKVWCQISKWAYELELPKSWCVHPVFHVTLLTPFRENDIYGKAPVPLIPKLLEGEYE